MILERSGSSCVGVSSSGARERLLKFFVLVLLEELTVDQNCCPGPEALEADLIWTLTSAGA